MSKKTKTEPVFAELEYERPLKRFLLLVGGKVQEVLLHSDIHKVLKSAAERYEDKEIEVIEITYKASVTFTPKETRL